MNAFAFFCRYIDPKFFAEREFFDDIVNTTYDFLLDEDSNLLSINLPQSAGKSYFANILSAFLIGIENDISILRITNTQDVADNFTKQVAVMLESEEYMSFFPNLPSFANNNATEIRLKGNWNFSLRGVGADVTTMSRRTRLIIIDDLYRSFGDAMSLQKLKKLIQKWETEWRGRQEGSYTKVIIVGTRYSRNDFYAYLEKSLNVFKTIKVPALDENDNSFCEFVRSTQWLLDARANILPDLWNAIYQQEPTAEGLVMLFANHKPIIQDLSSVKFDRYISITDPSFGVGGDFFVSGVFGIHKATIFLVDLLFERRIESDEYFKYLKSHSLCKTHLIEQNGVGNLVLNDAAKIKFQLRPFTSTGDKYNRIFSQVQKIKNIVFSDTIPTEALTQLLEYPDVENDDFPDMLASACRIIHSAIIR